MRIVLFFLFLQEATNSVILSCTEKATISNDGATILRLLDIVHPAAKTLVDIARAQDAEVGDGTTSVTLFAGELLKEIRPFIEDGMNPQVLVKGFRHASTLVPLFGFAEKKKKKN